MHTDTQESIVLDIESITNSTFNLKRPAIASWLYMEVGYVQIENENKELVRYNPSTGERTVLISLDNIIDDIENPKMLNYLFSDDESILLLTLQNGDTKAYYLFDRINSSLTKIDVDKYRADIESIKLSPDNEHMSFIHGANIYVYNFTRKESIQLTMDGSEKIINSTASFRFASVRNSREYKWSPDSRYIAFNQFNTEGVRSFSIINNLDSLYPSVDKFQHVKPGETLPSVRTGIIEVSNRKTTWLNVAGDSRNNYITNLTWNPESNELFIQQLNRNQKVMYLLVADTESGTTQKIYTESEETFLESFNLRWINNGKYFLWMSEKDGWRHIYKISTDGNKTMLITPGEFDVSRLTTVDELNKWVYFEASPKSTIHSYGYRVLLDGSGEMERLTPENVIGTNSYFESPDGKWAFHFFSRFDKPTAVTLISLPDHKVIKIIENNGELVAKLKAINPSPVEYSKIEIEKGVSLDSWMIKPTNFDPLKKYPVIMHVYSMPAAHTTVDRWKGKDFLFYQLLAKKGFIVMGIDGRGTPSLEGKEWRKSIYLKHGVLPADDIAKATEIILKEKPFMDTERIGVYGWSGGGLMSLMLILRHPEIFNTAIPGAYLSHHKYYQAGFTERFLGTPQENPDAYEETAVLNYAKNLKGNLLLIHGTGDDNVHYQNTEALINKLIEEKKRFVVIPYPNRNHNMYGQNTLYHLFDTYLWYFTEHLMPDK